MKVHQQLANLEDLFGQQDEEPDIVDLHDIEPSASRSERGVGRSEFKLALSAGENRVGRWSMIIQIVRCLQAFDFFCEALTRTTSLATDESTGSSEEKRHADGLSPNQGFDLNDQVDRKNRLPQRNDERVLVDELSDDAVRLGRGPGGIPQNPKLPKVKKSLPNCFDEDDVLLGGHDFSQPSIIAGNDRRASSPSGENVAEGVSRKPRRRAARSFAEAGDRRGMLNHRGPTPVFAGFQLGRQADHHAFWCRPRCCACSAEVLLLPGGLSKPDRVKVLECGVANCGILICLTCATENDPRETMQKRVEAAANAGTPFPIGVPHICPHHSNAQSLNEDDMEYFHRLHQDLEEVGY